VKACLIAIFLSSALVVTPACSATHQAPILVGQTALAVASSIERLSITGRQLQEAAILTPAAALGFQRALLAVNTQLQPLPDLLRTIDALQQAGASTTSQVDRAIAILSVAGQNISVVIAGVPLSETTEVLIGLVRTAQKTVTDVLIEVAKIKGRA